MLNRINRLVTTVTLSLTTLLTATSVNAPRAEAQDTPQICSFNGQPEFCTILIFDNNDRLVTWLSDGKTVFYSFYNCVSFPDTFLEHCDVEIQEDNGHVSHGTSRHGPEGTVIWSENGNRTEMPLKAQG